MIAIPEPPIVSARIGLLLLRSELNRAILQALAAGLMSIGDLCGHLMLESDTTLREQLDQLAEVGVVERQAQARGPTSGYRITPAGGGLLEVMALTGGWLVRRPGRSLSPESDAGWRAFRALGDGWELSLIQHLVLRPSTKAELLATIPRLGKEKAKRMLRRLRGAGLVEPLDGEDRAPRHALTVWARRAIAVLAAIAAWERGHLQGAVGPVAASDGAVALLATLPLVRPPADAAGVCAFTVEGEPGAAPPRFGAVWAHLARGRITFCRSGSSPVPPDAWVHGSVDAWLEAVVNGRPAALRLGGDRMLAECVLRGLHEELFGAWAAPL